jgi:hypothetical protein
MDPAFRDSKYAGGCIVHHELTWQTESGFVIAVVSGAESGTDGRRDFRLDKSKTRPDEEQSQT